MQFIAGGGRGPGHAHLITQLLVIPKVADVRRLKVMAVHLTTSLNWLMQVETDKVESIRSTSHLVADFFENPNDCHWSTSEILSTNNSNEDQLWRHVTWFSSQSKSKPISCLSSGDFDLGNFNWIIRLISAILAEGHVTFIRHRTTRTSRRLRAPKSCRVPCIIRQSGFCSTWVIDPLPKSLVGLVVGLGGTCGGTYSGTYGGTWPWDLGLVVGLGGTWWDLWWDLVVVQTSLTPNVFFSDFRRFISADRRQFLWKVARNDDGWKE